MDFSNYWILGLPLYMVCFFLLLIYIADKVIKAEQAKLAKTVTTTTRIIELPLKLVVEITE